MKGFCASRVLLLVGPTRCGHRGVDEAGQVPQDRLRRRGICAAESQDCNLERLPAELECALAGDGGFEVTLGGNRIRESVTQDAQSTEHPVTDSSGAGVVCDALVHDASDS